MANTTTWVEYMCSYCGRKMTKLKTSGRPLPSVCSKKHGKKPHSRIKNRTW
ncbi:MAG: hypothetical protein ACI4WH_02835 [Oscillospiraceae bacterium]